MGSVVHDCCQGEEHESGKDVVRPEAQKAGSHEGAETQEPNGQRLVRPQVQAKGSKAKEGQRVLLTEGQGPFLFLVARQSRRSMRLETTQNRA